MTYVPSDDLLKKYADVLIKFALNSGKGIKKGEVVLLQVPECAKPMLRHLRNSVLEAGGHAIMQYMPDGLDREYFDKASDEQLSFFPDKYLKGKIDQIDHSVGILAQVDKYSLVGIDPKKIMIKKKSLKPYMDWRMKKENAGDYTWTLAMYGTKHMAEEVNMSLEEYWKQIIDACYLNEDDPIAKWKSVYEEMERVRSKLDELQIDSVHVEADNTNINIGIGARRSWKSGGGRNIPSFEIFTSPDWRRVDGHIQFTEPLYYMGNLIKDVYLEFENGEVIKSSASEGEEVLKEMLAQKNANKAGEFSLTDSRVSKITKFMGETLYDENVGGEQGNTHIAVGMAYKDCFDGNPAEITNEEWDKLGYNDSVIHTDIVATSRRTVTATLPDGEKLVIYKDGKFTI